MHTPSITREPIAPGHAIPEPPPVLKPERAASEPAGDDLVEIGGEPYLCIRQIDRMPPFLMSVVSDSDFWLFVGSNGGFTAGRVDPDHAVFPYQTADKILGQPGAVGALSLMVVDGNSWEPWAAACPPPGITRNLYKHISGCSVIFEEINDPLKLTFRWELTASERFGLVRRCRLENLTNQARRIRILDGFHHMLPAGVSQETYSRYSYLAAAYMRHEADPASGLGIYTLNSGITDRAEPCESLRASCAWSSGLPHATLLLSDSQVNSFRHGSGIEPETEVRGVFGAHLLGAEFHLPARGAHEWFVVADTGLDHTELTRLKTLLLQSENLAEELNADLAGGLLALQRRIAGAGAIQQSADSRTGIHHFANVLFNCMRGGTLHDNYSFPRDDFKAFLGTRNGEVLAAHEDWLATLPDPCTLEKLTTLAATRGDAQLARLAGEYLPICFSRRHGDPSRPWNRFEIHTKDSNGLPLFAYAGNWRDIFQNWESLAMSYPSCFEPMINIFLNASTADGYNPYRITRAGIDWEVFDPADPWSHIGYWGDHQIIYLLRLLEGQERFLPGRLTARLNQRSHTYANVPYEIAGFDQLLKDPKNSIVFNQSLHEQLMARAATIGGDGKLLADPHGDVALVSLAEKLLVPLLVKLTNLVPGGGIWLNTQRPEWNDANNALAGWGLSVVTVCYMRRYLVFLGTLFNEQAPSAIELSTPVAALISRLADILPSAAAAADLDDTARLEITRALGLAGEKHRAEAYTRKPAALTSVDLPVIRDCIAKALAAIDATLRVNRREDALYHSYNLLAVEGNQAAVRHLDLMLEGQVAALSSGALDPAAALHLLEGLRESQLYREDQHSYLLYPDRTISPFLERNTLPRGWENKVPRLAEMARAGDRDLIRIDDDGRAHFHPDLTNSKDLLGRLDLLAAKPGGKEAAADREPLLDMWEQAFHHHSFTGRSGAMFGFEGLGSIYWHMISKLLLAVQEIHEQAVCDPAHPEEALRLAETYEDIRKGLGFTKDSSVYGAFPTDPYSHSPRHIGAQQPGMTGQVKEEILTRMGELGVHVEGGSVRFSPVLLKPKEFFQEPHVFTYIDIDGETQTWRLGRGTLAFTLFQVPVCYQLGDQPGIILEKPDGASPHISGNLLPSSESRHLFERDGLIRSVTVTIQKTQFQPKPTA